MIQETYYQKSFAQNKILGYALMNAELFCGGLCIASFLKKEEMDKFGVTSKDLDGIVAQLRNTSGVEVAIFMYELEPEVYKVSLRASNYANVSEVAQMFGGGGHVKAAGCSMSGAPEEIMSKLTEQLELQFRR